MLTKLQSPTGKRQLQKQLVFLGYFFSPQTQQQKLVVWKAGQSPPTCTTWLPAHATPLCTPHTV